MDSQKKLVPLKKTGNIAYKLGNNLDLEQVISLYKASTLGERRPVNEKDRMKLMLQNADIIITAWEGDLLVGIARSLSDIAYTTYLADLAVRVSHQKKGIGKELIKLTQSQMHEKGKITLLAAPSAASYYPHIGFVRHNSAWQLKPGAKIK